EKRKRVLIIGLAVGAVLLVGLAVTLLVILAERDTKAKEDAEARAAEARAEEDAEARAAEGRAAGAGRVAEGTAKAINALGRIEAAVEVGVTYGRLGELLGDAKAAVNEAERVLPSGEMRTNLSGAMRAYVDARQVWDFKIYVAKEVAT